MSQPVHTPYLRAAFPAIDTLQRTKIYGPKHPDGGEYAAICEISDENMARQMVAAYNAFDSAAKRLNCNAVELAERMQDGEIAEIASALGELVGFLDSEYGSQEVDRNCPSARAVLAKVKGGAA